METKKKKCLFLVFYDGGRRVLRWLVTYPVAKHVLCSLPTCVVVVAGMFNSCCLVVVAWVCSHGYWYRR
jgi:hypothetical protein